MTFKTAMNKSAVNVARFIAGRLTLKICHAKVKKYKPTHDTFIVISNHSDGLDPVYELCTFKKYIRIVMSDHIVNNPVLNVLFRKISGFIIRDREEPTQKMVDDILKSVKEGVCVGLYAEGTITPNGETGFFSPRTGQLIKDSGVALITFRVTGGYFHTPKWGTGMRRGPVHSEVVREYSPEELQKMTVEEINEAICEDIYVNAFDEQKKKGHRYKSKNCAEHVERVLYMCPHCKEVGNLHSKGNFLKCDCGYKVELNENGFFAPVRKELIFDNILDWDKWQKQAWKEKVLTAKPQELIFEEDGQIINTIVNKKRNRISDNATLRLYQDRFEISFDEKTIVMDIKKMKLVMSISIEALILMDENNYFYIKPRTPRAASKYIAAWRYLNGKDYK